MKKPTQPSNKKHCLKTNYTPKRKVSKDFFNPNEEGITLQVVIIIGVLALAAVGASAVIYNTVTDDVQEVAGVATSATDIADYFSQDDGDTQANSPQESAALDPPELTLQQKTNIPGQTDQEEPRTAAQLSATDQILQISAGRDHSCAIVDADTSDSITDRGNLYCWGSDGYGRLGDSEGGLTKNQAEPHSRENTDKNSPSQVVLTPAIVQVPEPVLVLGVDDAIGPGDTADAVPLTNAFEVSAGFQHTCAVANAGSDRTAYCWGYDGEGRLGDGVRDTLADPLDFVSKNYAVRVATNSAGTTFLNDVDAISAGGRHTCAIAEASDNIYCWGANDYGQLGIGSTASKGVAFQVGTLVDAIAISAGWEHTCAIIDQDTSDSEDLGDIQCWGRDNYGQLGDDDIGDGGSDPDGVRNTPARVDGLSDASAISAGRNHTCAILDNNAVFCWGADSYDQLGNGADDECLGCGRTNTGEPTQVSAPAGQSGFLTGATVISAGWGHTCAIASSTAYCWGYDGYGQLGDGGATNDGRKGYTPSDLTANIPVAVLADSGTTSLAGVIDISAGGFHTCASAGTSLVPYCWGYDRYGQIGDGGNDGHDSAHPSADDKTRPARLSTS